MTYSTGGRDLFTQYLLDLVGLGTAGLRDRQEIDDEAFLHYVSLIASQLRSAVALEQMIADYFEVPVEIQQFTGGWYGLDRETQCAMNEEESPSTPGWFRGCGWRRRVGPAIAGAHSHWADWD